MASLQLNFDSVLLKVIMFFFTLTYAITDYFQCAWGVVSIVVSKGVEVSSNVSTERLRYMIRSR